jgi:hypothetical protein
MWRRSALLLAAVVVGGCGGGERLSKTDLPSARRVLHVTSPALAAGARLARRYTCDGAGDEPGIRVAGVPAGTRELVLVVSDPDAPGGTFVHLTRYGLGPRGPLNAGREGANSAGSQGWTPPCPPKGEAAHRYVWTVYALPSGTGLTAGAGPAEVTAAIAGRVSASGRTSATYSR